MLTVQPAFTEAHAKSVDDPADGKRRRTTSNDSRFACRPSGGGGRQGMDAPGETLNMSRMVRNLPVVKWKLASVPF